jgi:hypothetical protein
MLRLQTTIIIIRSFSRLQRVETLRSALDRGNQICARVNTEVREVEIEESIIG